MEFKLIIKKLNNTLTNQEEVIFNSWYNESETHRAYFDSVSENYSKDLDIVDVEKGWNAIEKQIKPALNKTKNNYLKYVAVAASLVLLISITFIFNKNDAQVVEPVIVNNNIKIGADKATLTLETGETIALEKGNTYETQNVTSNGKEIIYHVGEKSKAEIAYNTLTIPRGGKFYMMLSDSTKVWLNSESQLKYPVAFNDGQLRQVELVYGEAYFEVSHSTEHKGSHFKVIHNKQEVEVLGTEFNIKAYKEEKNIYTTLVKGKVEVSFETQSKILKPGEQSNLNPITKVLGIADVNVYDQTSWKEGVFSFKRKTLKEIMQVLSRWYDMEVDFENKDLESIGFNGVVGKEQSIEEILETIKNLGVIKNYEINNKTIMLK
ncbi:FecR family protein [Confluentibacter sediminis]|uniref:FecR family protein n=1 Tax=Confluentibacter sediminis TaxID=2219045 RepID=UPI000DAC9A9D|nr:FecR family protein [Confluentibacter sediminis]